jgi:uncharacterized membrane protein
VARKTIAGLPIGSWVLVTLFNVSGIMHLINPEAFLWLMPPFLPYPIELILVTGVAELAAALMIVLRSIVAPYLAVGVLLLVWPANWWFAIDALTNNPDIALLAWLRLPLQLPLIWWAWKTPVKELGPK